MAPYIAAIAADAVLFVNLRLIGFADGSMALAASQPGAVRMDRMRKPHIGRLPRRDQPGRFVARFDVVVNQRGFGLGCSELFGVASRADFRWRHPYEFSICV